ncbi:MAG TPA: M66 family metalloprotease [Polyangiales bacterium]|nr:M66 family metalloprotease [Polyangiales bacterium]
MQPSRRSLTTALLLLAGCSGFVEPKNGGLESDPDNVRAVEGKDAGRRDARDDDDIDPVNEVPTVRADGGGEPDEPRGCVETEDFPLAQGLQIREVALYQTVKIPLFEGGAWVNDRVAPVVQNKKALLRVFVDPQSGYQPHDVRAVLKLVNGGDADELIDERTISAASTDASLASTFSFQIDPGSLGNDAQLSVTLVETNCGAVSGAPTDTRVPSAGGTQALQAAPINKLKVVVLPISVGGRVPVTTETELANIRSALLAYYPVPDVDLSVRTPLVWSETVDPLDGNSWSDLLNAVMRERRTDAPASNVYYLGLVQPAATFRTYCQRGCVLGLAPQTSAVQASAQVALGASFADAQTYETVVHELGHAHGRGHAPCVEAGEIDGVDPNYPDKTGSTVSWGWDSRSNTLLPPTNKDIMGYCEPNWIGAYNYSGLAARSQSVNLKALRVGSGLSWQNVVLYDDGKARWGGDLLREDPAGEYESAQVLDASGRVIDTVEVVRLGLSHAGAQFVYLPQPGAQWSAVKLTDRLLELSAVLPPL